MATFLTGATGFVGRYLAQRMLEQGEELVLLVRGEREQGRRRLRQALAFPGAGDVDALLSRACVCPGDLGTPELGLAGHDRERIVSSCDRFLHCGANVRFDLSLEAARAVNVAGTAGVLDLARERQRRHGLERVDFVSTAYVAGCRTGTVAETELDVAAGHRNTYERSKFEAERLVWRAAPELPVSVFRPSIVVGESATGRTPSFQTIYLPIRIYARGLWRTLPARAENRIDLVPVDFVRDAILEIRRSPASLGGCFHLAAGPAGDVTVRELVGIVERHFPGRRSVRIVDPERWRRYLQPLLRLMRFGRIRQVAVLFDALYPYLVSNPRFDNANTRKALADSAIRLPDVRTYFDQLLGYGVATDWGRRGAGKGATG